MSVKKDKIYVNLTQNGSVPRKRKEKKLAAKKGRRRSPAPLRKTTRKRARTRR